MRAVEFLAGPPKVLIECSVAEALTEWGGGGRSPTLRSTSRISTAGHKRKTPSAGRGWVPHQKKRRDRGRDGTEAPGSLPPSRASQVQMSQAL